MGRRPIFQKAELRGQRREARIGQSSAHALVPEDRRLRIYLASPTGPQSGKLRGSRRDLRAASRQRLSAGLPAAQGGPRPLAPWLSASRDARARCPLSKAARSSCGYRQCRVEQEVDVAGRGCLVHREPFRKTGIRSKVDRRIEIGFRLVRLPRDDERLGQSSKAWIDRGPACCWPGAIVRPLRRSVRH